MLAQAPKVEYQSIKENPEKPVYGGLSRNTNSSESLSAGNQTAYVNYLRKTAAASINNNNPAALVDIADIHFANGQFGRALKTYLNAYKIDTNNAHILLQIIKTYQNLENFQKADHFYSLLLEKTEHHPKYVSQFIAYKISNLINYPDTPNNFAEIVNRYKTSTDDNVLNSLGIYFLSVETDNSLAAKYFKKALEINPDNVDANNNFGITLRYEDKITDAIKYLQKAHFINLSYPAAYENLASIYYIQNNIDKAIEILQTAIDNQIQISAGWVHNLAYFYHLAGNQIQAINLYKQLIKQEPDNNLLTNNLAVCYKNEGKYNLAIKNLLSSINTFKLRAKEKKPFDLRSILAFNNLTRAYIYDGKNAQANSILEQSKRYFPSNDLFHHLKGMIYLNEKKYEDAKRHFELSIDRNPDYIETYVDYSFILEEVDFDFQKAVEVLEPIVTKFSDEPNLLIANNLAYAYLRIGNIDEAKKYLLESDDSYASFATKGYYNLLIDNFQKAEQFYARALKSANNNSLLRVKQIYNFELMEYWDLKGKAALALKHAEEALDYPVSERIDQMVKDYVTSHSKLPAKAK